MLMAGDRRNYFIVILCLFALVVGPVLTERVFNIASVYSTRWVVFCFELVLLAAVWVVLKNKEDDGGAVFSQFESRCLLAWLMLSMVSVIFSDHMAASLVRQSEWYAIFGVIFVFGRYVSISPAIVKFFYIFLSLLFVYVVLRYMVAWSFMELPRQYDWVFNPPVFFHIRHLNYLGVMACAGSLSFFYLRNSRFGFSYLIFVFLVFLASTAIFWGGARSGFVCLLFLFFINVAFVRNDRSVLVDFVGAWLGAILVALCVASYFAVENNGMGFSLFHGRDAADADLDALSSGRLSIWLVALKEVVYSYSVFGLGPDSYIYSGGKDSNAAHPHSFIVQFIGDWGIGAIFIGLFYFLVMKRSVFTYKSGVANKNLLFVSWVFVAVVFLLGVFTGPFYHAWSLSLFSLGFACFIGLRRVAFGDFIKSGGSRVDGAVGRVFYSYYAWGGLIVVMGIHATVNLVQQGPMPSSPYAPKALIVKYFPSHSLVMGSWYAEWIRKYPSIGLDGLHWLQKNSISNFSWSYYMAEADFYRDNGDFDKAKELYLIALTKATVGGAKSEVQQRLDDLLSLM